MGETYDESVDVYSFSILLLAMAVEGNLTEWFLKRYQASHWHHKSTRNPKKKSPKILKALRMLWEEGWRPYNPDDENNDDGAKNENEGGGCEPLSFVPTTIRSLIVRCGSHDPSTRPTFEEIMDDLEGPVLNEVSSGVLGPDRKRKPFVRHDPLAAGSVIASGKSAGDAKKVGKTARPYSNASPAYERGGRPSLAPSPSLEETYQSRQEAMPLGDEEEQAEVSRTNNPMRILSGGVGVTAI